MRRRSLLKLALKFTGTALAVALLPATLLPLGAAQACRVFPPDGETDFMALRHGRVVGRHRIRFSRAGGYSIVLPGNSMVNQSGRWSFSHKNAMALSCDLLCFCPRRALGIRQEFWSYHDHASRNL